jgi:excisionase family DNA binding protein
VIMHALHGTNETHESNESNESNAPPQLSHPPRGGEMEEQREVTPGDVAQREGVEKATVIRWCREGKLRARRTPGGRWRIAVDAKTGRPLKPGWLRPQ